MYLHLIGCKGSNDGQFARPHGLVIDKYNQLIVCDTENGRVQLFNRSGKFLSKLRGEYFGNSNFFYSSISNDSILFAAGLWEDCVFVFC